MTTLPHRLHVVSPADEAAINPPERVTIALGERAGAVKQGLLALSVRGGLAVVDNLFDAEITKLVGPRGRHDAMREAYRHGGEPRQLTLGRRRVQVMKPRARTKRCQEVELESYWLLLTSAAFDRVLNGLSPLRYRRGLEPVGDLPPLATGKAAISRRFVLEKPALDVEDLSMSSARPAMS